MTRRKRTGFDRYVNTRMKERAFAEEYAKARAEIDYVDRLIRFLDEARVAVNLDKAELARRIGAKPEIVRRLFTAKSPNPTMNTMLKLASALGFRLELVPDEGPRPTSRGPGREGREATA